MVLGPVVVLLMTWLFQIPWWAGVIAVPLAVVMGFVAARVTGETDVTPTKALGPVTQLLYGVITPGNRLREHHERERDRRHRPARRRPAHHAQDRVAPRGEPAGAVLGASSSACWPARPIVVPAYTLIIGQDPGALGSEEWPAPSCLVWAGVSQAFAGGVGGLGTLARSAIAAGLLLGIALALLEKLAPKPVQHLVPSPSGIGIAMVIPGSNAVAMFLGALLAWGWRRWQRASADRYVTPIASGLIAGESLMGVVVALLVAFKVIQR